MPPAIAAVVMALAVAVYGHGNLKRSVAAKDDCAYYSQACIDTARTCVNGNTGACGTFSASAVLPLHDAAALPRHCVCGLYREIVVF